MRKTLSFPNASRSFDAVKGRVRFWGYDSAIEISFFVGVEVLLKLNPNVDGTEDDLLMIFDSRRAEIHAIAARIYGRSKGTAYAYTVAAEDVV